MATRLLFVASIFSAILFTSFVYATNLLPNGSFDSGVAGWQVSGVDWNSDDASGNANSGSIQLEGGNQGASASVTFLVTPGATYTYGASSKFIRGTDPADQLYFFCVASNDGVTTTPLLPQPVFSHDPAWSIAAPVSGTLPADAVSVSCYAALSTHENHPDFPIARFDDLFFESPAITTSVRLQSFTVQ